MNEIHRGWIGIILDIHIWEKFHKELTMRCFDISKFGAFRSVEKWDCRSREVARRILIIVCEETCGRKLENLRVRVLEKWCLE
jgi:hypothetical protein